MCNDVFEFVDDNIVCMFCRTVMHITCKCDNIELIYDCYCCCCGHGYQVIVDIHKYTHE